MNYMKQIAEMLGVEFGERFRLFDTCEKEEDTGIYWVDEEGMHKEYSDGSKAKIAYTWDCILTGGYEIVKLPWKPKEGDMCYYVTPNGSLASMAIDISHTRDLLLVHNGMVYRTAEEASEHKDETMRKWAEIRKELEE